MSENQKINFMRRALRLAESATAGVAPNPRVGALIVKNDRVLGRGFHKQFGGPHAEIEALLDCRIHGHDPAGSTMFVTLEPCCHQGKTGPCVEAIIQARIRRVEIATRDDFALVNGRGIEQLQQNGIDVQVGCCEQEARQVNFGFFKLQKEGIPQVILKWAQSIDGQLSWPPDSKKRWLTNEQSRQHVHLIRSRCGAILVGIGTVLADNPQLNARLETDVFQPRRVILDNHLRIPLSSNLVQTARQQPVYIYTSTEACCHQSDKMKILQKAGCRVISISLRNNQVDLQAVLHDLGRQGVTDLLVEGGPTILKSFGDQNLADKIMIYIAPVLINCSYPETKINFPLKLDQCQNIQLQNFAGDLLFQAQLVYPF